MDEKVVNMCSFVSEIRRFNSLLKYIPTVSYCIISFLDNGMQINNGILEFVHSGVLTRDKVEFLVIPDIVSVIGNGGYSCGLFEYLSNLRTVILHNKVVKIGSKAFFHCQSLERLDLPNSIVEIDDLAFWDCPKLERLILPKGLKK